MDNKKELNLKPSKSNGEEVGENGTEKKDLMKNEKYENDNNSAEQVRSITDHSFIIECMGKFFLAVEDCRRLDKFRG